MAAYAYFYEDRWVLAVKRGMLLAVKEMLGE